MILFSILFFAAGRCECCASCHSSGFFMRLSPTRKKTFLTYIVFQRVTTSVTKLLTFIVTHLSHFYHSILLFAVCIVFCTKWHFSGVKRQWMPKKDMGCIACTIQPISFLCRHASLPASSTITSLESSSMNCSPVIDSSSYSFLEIS